MLIDTLAAAASDYRRDLGDGLILRWSTAADTENLAQLCGMVFRDKEDDPLNEHLQSMVRQLMSGDHPVMGPGDFGLVEDTTKEGNPLVACTCLQRLEWNYEGIPFQIGRPEIVASDPAYRKRGLIRELFAMIHARSEAEKHLVQAITGISYFYRQFGYEYALDLGGKRTTYLSLIPKAKEGESEAYTLRDATPDDIPQMLECYYNTCVDSIVWTTFTEQQYRYRFSVWEGRRTEGKRLQVQAIIDATGKVHGFVYMPHKRWDRRFSIWGLEFAPGSNLLAIMPSLLRGLQAHGQQAVTEKEDTEPFSEIHFHLGRRHPFYQALGDSLAPASERPYAWYVRVPNLPAFLKHIAPALEKRLANSAAAGYTGELKLTFYRGGLRLAFENGRLTTAEPWQAPIYNANANAGFPPLVFLQLLFGRRSLDQLCDAFPDVWTDNTGMLLNTLFPARPSFVAEF